MLKKLLLLQTLVLLNITLSSVLAEIIPLKKPLQTKEEKEQKLLIDIIKPLPKPIVKKIIEKDKTQTETKTIVKKEKKLDIILPKKKPLIAGSEKTKIVKKSKYYSKKDFALAKKAILEMKQAKWPNALKTAKKAKGLFQIR